MTHLNLATELLRLGTGPEAQRLAIQEIDGSGRALTYADLASQSARFAHALCELGVMPGDRVVVQVEKSVEAILLYLAVLRVGAVFLPLNTAYTPSEVEYFLKDSQPALFVCRREDAEPMKALSRRLGIHACETLDARGRGSLVDAVERQPSTAFLDVARAPRDLAAILYTSGTTGRSKGAMLTHDNLASNARALVETWRFTQADVLIHALPIFHTHGLFVGTNVVLLSGASMLFLRHFDPAQVLNLMPRATVLMGVPTFYTRLLQQPGLSQTATARMRLFISGSAPLLVDTHREWQARTGHEILERYGMTETGMNTSNPCDGERVAGTVGFPLPQVHIRIADPKTGAILGRNEVGVIEVSGPNVFKGYWRMPEKTASEFRPDGFFITGDLGKIDKRGYVHIVGRHKDLIITGGFNVYPKEIETEIDAVPGVMESAVIGVPHPDFGEGVTAVVVREKGATITGKDILSIIEGRLAKFKLPKRIVIVDELPRNAMGKVQKNVLRQSYIRLYEPSKSIRTIGPA